MIILIRHAQSEGNKNRDIHQYIPDHRVKLTPDGQLQALEAGRRLRALLKPDDTIQFFTSPYRRTRETTEGILRTLTGNDEELGPSPFPRDKVKVYEEPRLREQDFGNFQPCSNEMERMWQERADYGHFFYRIPSGESAADAYDRVSGFNESLWRQFGDSDFPSVCILVTHGLMTRVFLMKWYHWSVEYFEDLRNINHCEFIIMKQNYENGKFILQNELRTWSDLKRKAALQNTGEKKKEEERRPQRMWGGCAMGCNHKDVEYPKRPRRQNTQDFLGAKSVSSDKLKVGNGSSRELSSMEATHEHHHHHQHHHVHAEEDSPAEDTPTTTLSGSDADVDADSPILSSSPAPKRSTSGLQLPIRQSKGRPATLMKRLGRDGGGSQSGLGSPNDISDEADDSDWFDTNVHQLQKRMSFSQSQAQNPARSDLSRSALSLINEGEGGSPLRSRRSGSLGRSNSGKKPGVTRSGSAKRRSDSVARRKDREREREMIVDSGMTGGRRADALGDMDDEDEIEGAGDGVEQAKMKDRKSFSEIY
jgi:broad specificity phosphatase PhoE